MIYLLYSDFLYLLIQAFICKALGDTHRSGGEGETDETVGQTTRAKGTTKDKGGAP